MKLKKYIKNKLVNIADYRVTQYYKKKLVLSERISLVELSDKNCLDLVTIAFNNPTVIEYQIRLLKVFMKDPYHYTVADNSNNDDRSNRIREICRRENVPYMKLPSCPYCKIPGEGSNAHGASLNYIYRNFFLKRKAKFCGFLDHDIFPVQNIEIIPILKKQHFYGWMHNMNQIKYRWSGLCFFQFDFLKKNHVDFRPLWDMGGDTGAANYHSLYRPYLKKIANYQLLECVRKQLWQGNDVQGDMYSVIGEKWLHMNNASEWKKVDGFHKKELRIYQMLDEFVDDSNLA